MSTPAPQVRSRLPRFAEAAVERVRLTVVPPRRSRAPRVPFIVLVSAVLLTGVIGLLLFNTSMQQASFAATALEEQASNLSAREQTLQMELERLRDPQRVAEAARRQGLVLAQAPAFLHLDTGTITGHEAPATAEGDITIAPPPPVRPAELDPAPVTVRVPQQRDRDRPVDRDRDRERDQRTDRDRDRDRRDGVGDRDRRDGEPRLGRVRNDDRRR